MVKDDAVWALSEPRGVVLMAPLAEFLKAIQERRKTFLSKVQCVCPFL